MFNNFKDSEEFATRHSQKFNVQFIHRQSFDSKMNKKNVSFIENSNAANDSYGDYMDNDSKNKSILKNNQRSSVSPSPLTSPFSLSPKSNESSNSNSDIAVGNQKNDTSLLVSTNSAKNKKTEGYEILVILSFFLF